MAIEKKKLGNPSSKFTEQIYQTDKEKG